jgi:uncharacterized protein YbaR (Trm112 family)
MRHLIWHSYRFYQRKIAGARKIEGLVLDVGSGNSPFPRADILAEKFLVDDSNRIWGRKPILSAPTVACDAEALPFADDTFDFVVASHLLEHVDRPDIVMKELSRVGKAGYIECPDAAYDKLDSPPYHRWFVEESDGRLIFTQKSSAVFDAGIKDLTHNTLYREGGFWAVFWKRLESFFIMYRWQGDIDFEVHYLPLPGGEAGSADRSVFDDEVWLKERGFVSIRSEEGSLSPSAGIGERLLKAFWRALALVSRGRRPYPSPFDLVVCPADKSSLDLSGLSADRQSGTLRCDGCGRTYKVIDGIPYLFV